MSQLHRCRPEFPILLFFLFVIYSVGCRPQATLASAPPTTGAEARPHAAPVAPPPTVVAGYRTFKNAEPAPPDHSGLFTPRDVFQLEWASDPRISPDGRRVVYLRNAMDIMTDTRRRSLWIADADGNPNSHRPLTTSAIDSGDISSPRWSPDGARMAFVAKVEGKSQLIVRWMDTGQSARISSLTESPGDLSWSPDGRALAFTMLVPSKPKPLAKMPARPRGAQWAGEPRVIDRVLYRRDGSGYVADGFVHVFVVPADGGSPRQLTRGDFHHGGQPSWSPDSRSLIISANRLPDWEYRPTGAELFEIDVATGAMRALTARNGPDYRPRVSPDGKYIAYLGYDDRKQSYHITRLYIADRDGNNPRALWANFDRDMRQHSWSADSRGLFVRYDDQGESKLAYVGIDQRQRPARLGADGALVVGVGGTSIGRPYASGSFTVSRTGRLAFTQVSPERPADLAITAPELDRAARSANKQAKVRRLTALNDDLFGHKKLGDVEEVWFESSFDKRRIQGWLVKPPDFDPSQKYPLILEIHGGPFANYGPRFSAECQLYAAAGNLVLYINPRGSTSYGEEFGMLIHHNYPGEDYDDLMSGVDHIRARGYVDDQRLYVTGGSGGGVLTSWIVGKTNRFRAAVVAKPVINWYSFALSSDAYAYFWQYWFPGYPWDHPEHYHKRSPLSLVGNVETPTMLLTGEEDYRTPMSESEQYYQALKLRKVDSVLVRIPGASHSIARRPSQLIAKVVYILAWFQKYDPRRAQ